MKERITSNGRKRSRIMIAAVLVSAMILTLAGCGGTTLTSDESSAPAKDNMYTVVKNNIEVEYVENEGKPFESLAEGYKFTDDCTFYKDYVEISGLKDKEAEKKVNDRIREVVDTMSTSALPPYRGIKQKLPEGSEVNFYITSANDYANFNNIFSVVVTRAIDFTLPGTDASEPGSEYSSLVSVSQCEPLIFDLNTGDEIKVADVFDGNEYISVINSAIKQKIEEPAQDLYESDEYDVLVSYGDFKELTSEPKCWLTANGVSVVIDYTEPDFETNLHTNIVNIDYIDFGSSLLLDEKFMSEGSLFEDETVRQVFVPSYSTTVIEDSIDEISVMTEGNEEATLYVESLMKCNKDVPEAIRAKIREDIAIDENYVNEVKEQLAMGALDTWTCISKTAEINRVGKFANIYRYDSLPGTEYMESFKEFVYSEKNTVYNIETCEEVTVDDVFVEGYDGWKPVVTETYLNDMNTLGYLKESGVTLDMLSDLCDNITGFRLNNDSIYFYFDSEYLGSVSENYVPDSIYLDYSDLGYENLNIFNI